MGCLRKTNIEGDCLEKKLEQFVDLKGEGVGLGRKDGGGTLCTLCLLFMYTFSTFFCFSLTKMCFSLFHFSLLQKNMNQSKTRIGDQKLSVELYV